MNSGFDFDYAFEVKLITEVKKHPLIYDLSSEDYKNINLKENAWNKISVKVCGNEKSTSKCKKKWKHLRDSYKRCKERKQIRIGQKKPVRDWKHEKMLQFLEKCVSTKKLVICPYEETIRNFDDDNSTSDHNNDESFVKIDYIKPDKSIASQCQSRAEDFSDETPNTDRFNTDEMNEDSLSAFLSPSSVANRNRSNSDLCQTQEEHLTEFYAMKPTISYPKEKDSLSLLFDSLDKKIHQANLSEEQITEIESSVFSVVFFKLNEYRKIDKKK